MSREETLLGLWSKPGGPQWAGNLVIRDDGQIELEILSSDLSMDLTHHDIVLGYTGQELYTLHGLYNYSTSVGMGSSVGSKQRFYVDFAVKGIHLEDVEHKFSRFSFSLEGLQDWTQFTGITSKLTQVGTDPRLSRSYKHLSPDPVEIEAGDLSFRFIPTLISQGQPWSINLLEDTQVQATSTNPMTISEWLSTAVYPIKRLVQLSVRTGGTLQRLAVSNKLADTNDGARDPDWYPLLASYGGIYPYERKRSVFEKPMLLLNDFASSDRSLDTWLQLERKFREPIAGALDSRIGEPTSEYVFFVYVRLLERLVARYPQSELCNSDTMSNIVDYVKTLVPGDNGEKLGQKIGSQRRNDARVPLLASLREWIPLLSNEVSEEEISWIASSIIQTRNHFAHQGRSKPHKHLISAEEMGVFIALVKAPVNFEFIDQLGFDRELILQRVADSSQWRNARVVHDCWKDYEANNLPQD